MDLKNWHATYNTDTDKEIQGVDVPLGEGFVIRVARVGNKRAAKLFQELASAPDVAMARRAGALTEEKEREIMMEVYSKTILVGWSGLTDNGKEVPYSPEKAKELLAVPDFLRVVQDFAQTQENFRRASIEGATDALGKP